MGAKNTKIKKTKKNKNNKIFSENKKESSENKKESSENNKESSENNKESLENNKESSENNKECLNQNILSRIPNPSFVRKEIFSYSYCIGFEIYELKHINNAFYLALTPYGDKNDTVIYKYFYEKRNV